MTENLKFKAESLMPFEGKETFTFPSISLSTSRTSYI